jgi:hypothetical protein
LVALEAGVNMHQWNSVAGEIFQRGFWT